MFRNLRPKKSLGQNFLINQGILEKIVSAAELNGGDTVLEVGPGTGNLTKLISEQVLQQSSGQAGRVVAVEKDRRIIEDFKNNFPSVEIIEDDILQFKPTEHNLKEGNYKIVANIPYYITSNLLRTIFEKWPRPKLIVLTVQKEVAQRIVAKPPYMNLLALSVQLYSEPKIVGYISRGSFRPIPKVDSAIIRLIPRQRNIPEARLLEKKKFFKLIKAGFSGKRKQLKNTLSPLFNSRENLLKKLEELKISPESRPEQLNVDDWLSLSNALK